MLKLEKNPAKLISTGSAIVYEHGPRDKKKIALTFDADMTYGMINLLNSKIVKSWYNKEIKNTLDKENVPATIFFTGLWIKTYPKEAKDLAEDPLIEVENHSYSHPAFTQNCFKLKFITDFDDQSEIDSAQKEIEGITGKTPKYFRFPGGCYDKSDLDVVSRLGLKVVHWDTAGGDGFNNNANSIIQKVKGRVQNGSIIVLHLQGGPYAPKTNEAIKVLIPYFKKQGYQFVKVSDLLGSQ